MENIFNFVETPFMIVIAVLYILGIILKQTEEIKNNYIPLILTVFGVIFSGIYVLSNLSAYENVASAIFEAITQGILCAGMSVYSNQLLKQLCQKCD